jgi:hypothetical protein
VFYARRVGAAIHITTFAFEFGVNGLLLSFARPVDFKSFDSRSSAWTKSGRPGFDGRRNVSSTEEML